MNKKKGVLIGVAVVLVIAVSVAVFVIADRNRVRPFSLQDAYYQQMLEEFEINCMDDPVNSAKQARKAAENIWIETFGAEAIKGEKPYLVYYDEAEGVWLVTGSSPMFTLGGVAKALIREDGMILAVWHEK